MNIEEIIAAAVVLWANGFTINNEYSENANWSSWFPDINDEEFRREDMLRDMLTLSHDEFEAKASGVSLEHYRAFDAWQKEPFQCRGLNAKGKPCGHWVNCDYSSEATPWDFRPGFTDCCKHHQGATKLNEYNHFKLTAK